MQKLSDQKIELINSLLKEGIPLPEEYKSLLFESKSEYELTYAGKEREVDILADTMLVPLQPVKTFMQGESNKDWMNMLIFGDNLQVLKTLLQMKQEGTLKNSDGSPGVRLIYIDPPFATKQEFRGSQDQKAYQDKIAGSEFIEFLRKRLVFLRDLLSDDGSIYIHLDWKKAHYAKVIADEIFGEERFQREIIWRIGWISGYKSIANNWIRNHETLLFYVKDPKSFIFNKKYIPYPPDYERWGGRPKGQGYPIEDMWGVFEREGVTSLQVVSFSSENTGYPTQKPEGLLRRVIDASSNPGDLVLDCFAGSGTTLAAAEKLDRRWIGVDCGKLSIYTIQKRLLGISSSKDLTNSKNKYKKSCKPFILYNAGLYDYTMIKKLPWDQYREFALKLFQCRDEKHEISKVKLDGFLGADSVMVFNYQKHQTAVMDKHFIEDLHSILGNKIGNRFFIIAPSASVQFLEDYIQKGKTKYYILRIPYSIIEEIYNRGFSKIKQPVSELDVNNTVDAVGFDFIQVPLVECQYTLEDKMGQLGIGEGTKECVIKIDKFESKAISNKPLNFENLETLAMVMIDYDFDGEVFNLGDVFFAEDIKKLDYEIRFPMKNIKGSIMINYIDIYGNEKREIKNIADYKIVVGG
jgi:DNA modification methylase